MNTHSRQADARMEVLAVHAAMAGADRETVCALKKCFTTKEALDILEERGLLEETMRTVMEKIEYLFPQFVHKRCLSKNPELIRKHQRPDLHLLAGTLRQMILDLLHHGPHRLFQKSSCGQTEGKDRIGRKV